MGTWKQKRSRKKISLEKLQLRMTDAFIKLERVIQDDEYNPKQVHATINAVNSLANLAKKYTTLYTTVQLKKRIEELESKLEKQ